MNVLVTGCAGFIGSVVTERLIEAGYNVIGVDDLRSSYSSSVNPNIKFHEKSIGDAPFIEFSTNKIDCVCHFAAESIIGESINNPGIFFDNNVVNGIAMLNAMLLHGVKDIIYSSTASVYGNPIYTPINEDHPTKPINSYGESKLMFEHVLAWYARAYGIRYCNLRYFNVGGSTALHGENRRNETRLVPTAIKAIIEELPLHIFGFDYDTADGTCERDYVHVKDIANAHLLALKKLETRGESTYNLGGERSYSVLEIVNMLEEIIGKKAERIFTDRREGDPAVLLASNEQAKRELGWHPVSSDLHTILEDSYKWYLWKR